jgi:hypothetical protein
MCYAERASMMLARVGTQADNQKERSGACFSGSPIYSGKRRRKKLDSGRESGLGEKSMK